MELGALRLGCLALHHPGPERCEIGIERVDIERGVCRHPNGLAGLSVDEREGMFAVVFEEEVSFADGAAGDHLDGVDAAGIGLGDGDEFYVLGPA